MNTITLFEYESPRTREGKEKLKSASKILKKINKNLKAEIFKSNWEEIRATQYVGVITVKNTTIQILPKIYKRDEEDENKRIEEATRNLLFMLSFTKRLKLKEAGLSRLKREKADLYESIIYLFAKNLIEKLKTNYRREYERRKDELRFIKGKILLSKQIRKVTQDSIHCSFFEFSEDNILNRILKYTCYLLSSRVKTRENWVLLNNILSILDGVNLTPVTPSDFEKITFNRLNEDYEPFISLARLFLENMSLELQSSRFRTFSLLFDMNKLFEEFIGEFLKKNRKTLLEGTEFDGCEIKLQKSIGWLVNEPKSSFKLVPDIVFLKNGNTKLIMDTKYKTLNSKEKYYGVSQNDFYQMFAYAKKSNCSKIVLLYPWNKNLGDSAEGILNHEKQPYKINVDGSQINIYIVAVNLMRDLRNRNEREELKDNFKNIFQHI